MAQVCFINIILRLSIILINYMTLNLLNSLDILIKHLHGYCTYDTSATLMSATLILSIWKFWRELYFPRIALKDIEVM